MVLINLIGFLLSCIVLVKSAGYAIRYIAKVARQLKISEFLISFLIIGIVSSFPETFVAIVSALKGAPEIGFGTLLGSNIADLTLILGLVILVGGKIKIDKKSIGHDSVYIILCLLPIITAYDGVISRSDGLALALSCIFFFHHLIKERIKFKTYKHISEKGFIKNIFLFLISIIVLFITANFVVKFSSLLAIDLYTPPLLIGLILIALGTCLPEFMFAIQAIKKGHEELGLGDILGNVIIDATLIIGITALISPIILDRSILLVSGSFMILSVLIAIVILKNKQVLTQKEGLFLIFFYITFVIVELLAKNVI